tara:strand:+ start:44 stop:1366 length:1323 start_codon:yes stop_codon:yes gene_type:complete
LRILIKISSYKNKNNLSNIYFDIKSTNYRKKIKSELYVNKNNYTNSKISNVETNHISKNILLEKLKLHKDKALDNLKSGKWKLSQCEKYLKNGVEVHSIESFINKNFNGVSIFTKKDYLNTIGVFRKHLVLNKEVYLKDLNRENLVKFKTNALFNGIKISSVNAYLKKLKVIVNKASKQDLIVNNKIFDNTLIEKINKKESEKTKININDIEKAIFSSKDVYELQAISFFITMIMFKGMSPIEMVKYKHLNTSSITASKDNYIVYKSKGVNKFVKFNENMFKLIQTIKTSLYFTHFNRNPELLSAYNNKYEIFNLNISQEIKKHKNLWNIYQKKIKQLLGVSFRAANTVYIDFINNIEISHQVRGILVGKIDASKIIFDHENVLNNQINGVQNKMEVEFQLGKLIALIENKMALLGVKNLDDKVGRFQTPLDFIKNISKV